MSDRPAFDAVLAARLSRRELLTAAGAIGLAACSQSPARIAAARNENTFRSVAPHDNDAFVIADGYRWNVVARWGDSIAAGTPDFDTRTMTDTRWLDAGAVDAQHRRFGTNADAVQYFPLVHGRAARGLVCVNHEYFSAELMFPGHHGTGMKPAERNAWLDAHPQAVAFMQAAHGVSVMQLHRDARGWTRDITSNYNRRITSRTPIEIAGPARGHALLRGTLLVVRASAGLADFGNAAVPREQAPIVARPVLSVVPRS